MTQETKNLPLVLLILDGWGIAPPSRGNAFTGAPTPFYNELVKNYQIFSLAAGGEAVGLPWGEPGNSEVGHLNLGAGKIVYQPVLRINKSIENGTWFDNEVLRAAVNNCKQHNSSLHLLGLLSEGGVHSHQDHLYALLELAAKSSLKRVYVHVILDGRDTPYNRGLEYVRALERVMARLQVGKIATLAGRFYALDRDNNWDRVAQAYAAMARGEAASVFGSALEAVEASYQNKIYDEEFVPCLVKVDGDIKAGRIQPGDSAVFFNYRPDRARQLTKAFVLPTFDKFNRTAITNLWFVTLTEYEPDLPVKVAFPQETIERPLARVWSEASLTQLHIAETEKYAHVTYFFNGGADVVWPGQENVIIPSAGVPSYTDKPEMSVAEIAARAVTAIERRTHQCLVVNFANADMVGHTGNLAATRAAVGHVDRGIAALAGAVARAGGVVVITADHGKAEAMVNWETGGIIKEHTANAVPCLLVGEPFKLPAPRAENFSPHTLPVAGVLSDVAPTLLTIGGLPIPAAMTARSLL